MINEIESAALIFVDNQTAVLRIKAFFTDTKQAITVEQGHSDGYRAVVMVTEQ